MKSKSQKTGKTKEYICPICKKVIPPNEWNAYYSACNTCVYNSGRLG